MKTKELLRLIEKNGFIFLRANKHWLYNNGTVTLAIPRHTEVNKYLVIKILKQANIAY